MKNEVKAIVHMLGMEGNWSRNVFLPFTVSIACHLFFLIVLIFVPGLKISNRVTSSVIHVNMVTLHKGQSFRVRNPTTVKKSSAKTKKITEGVSFKAVSIAPKKKAKTSLNKKMSSNDVKNAIERVKNEAEASRPSEVTGAIESIKDQVDKTDANRLSAQNADKELSGTEPGVQRGSGPGGGSSLDILTLYKFEISDLVQLNWAYSEQLANAKPDLQTRLVFEVMPNGQIRDIWFTEKSGNRYLDESAHKAIMKSNPFPPHPVELSRPMVEVALRFSPKGLLD